MTRSTPAGEAATGPSLRRQVVGTAERFEVTQHALSLARPLLAPRGERVRLPLLGNGYAHEAAEVMRCLEEA